KRSHFQKFNAQRIYSSQLRLIIATDLKRKTIDSHMLAVFRAINLLLLGRLKRCLTLRKFGHYTTDTTITHVSFQRAKHPKKRVNLSIPFLLSKMNTIFYCSMVLAFSMLAARQYRICRK